LSCAIWRNQTAFSARRLQASTRHRLRVSKYWFCDICAPVCTIFGLCHFVPAWTRLPRLLSRRTCWIPFFSQLRVIVVAFVSPFPIHLPLAQAPESHCLLIVGLPLFLFASSSPALLLRFFLLFFLRPPSLSVIFFLLFRSGISRASFPGFFLVPVSSLCFLCLAEDFFHTTFFICFNELTSPQSSRRTSISKVLS